jgi:hypothetical protein
VQPAFQAFGGDAGARGVGRTPADLVGDEFDALQQTAAAHVADLFVAVLHVE